MRRMMRLFLVMASLAIVGGQTINANAADTAPSALPTDPLSLYKQTGINKEQEATINGLVKSFEQMTLEKGKIMMDLMAQMRQISLQPEIDEQAAIAKQAEINKLNAEMAIERIKILVKMRSVLTPEQKQAFVKLL